MATAQETSLEGEFQAAADEYNVPKELLKAMGYVNTRWEMPPPGASDYEQGGAGKGSPESRGNYGIMSLYQNPSTDTLGKAAELTGLSEEELKNNRAANIRGGAAVLANIQGNPRPNSINGWFDAVSDYGGGPVYANQVYQTLKDGASTKISSGETVTLEPQPDAETQQTVSAQSGSADYGRATWYGNGGNNFTNSNRESSYNIDKIVIHMTQGSWSSAINWFADPGNTGSSAHYTIRSSDGKIGQSVRESDIAWHAGWWDTNKHSIGIEHEGYISESKWFTGAMYRSSARLSAYLSKKYSIPIDRQHIIGHNEVPGCSGTGGGGSCHTDPGKYWDWPRYIKLVKYYRGKFGTSSTVYTQTVDNASSRFRATSDWGVSTYSPDKYGKNYRYIRPKSGPGSAKFLMRFPRKGKYRISARWPANSGYNNATRFLIRTTGGWKVRVINQRMNGGKWVYLGTFNMPAGDGSFIRVAKRSTGSGYVIADAVRIRER